MTNSITLTNAGINSGAETILLAGDFSYNWKNLTKADPGNGYFGSVETQFSGWENPTMNLTFHIPTDNIPTSSMTWALWNQFVKAQYTGSSSTTTYMKIKYGASDTLFADYSASSSSTGITSIPIQILGFGLNFSPADSDRAAFWSINAQLQVTK